MAINPLLKVTGLKRFFGSVKAVDGVSFSLLPGESVGLIGANGAGKTTLMRVLATLDVPDEGQIEMDGADLLATPNLRTAIGWMPDDFICPPSTTVEEYVDFYARAYRIKGRHRLEEVDRVLRFCGMDGLRDRLADKLSKGEKQRLSLARMLIGNPRLLIMDEPAAGLDPKARVEFKGYVRRLQAEGRTLLISSHILSELAEMCDRLIMMDAGTIIEQGTRSALVNAFAGDTIEVIMEVLGDPAGLLAELQHRTPWVQPSLEAPAAQDGTGREAAGAPAVSRLHAKLRTSGSEEERLRVLSGELRELSARFPLTSFARRETNLEETFIHLLNEHHA